MSRRQSHFITSLSFWKRQFNKARNRWPTTIQTDYNHHFTFIMTRCFIILTIIIGYFGTSAHAQEFMASGAIIEGGTTVRIALAEVVNTRNNYSVGSNDMGLFKIKALVGDTLLIMKRGFEDKKIMVSSSKDFVVYLTRGNTLSEVVINGNRKMEEMNDVKRDFRNKGSFHGGKPPFLSFLLTPLTAIYETFGRTPRNARRFNNYYNAELEQQHIDQYFNRTIINQLTGLDGKDLDQFMINNRPAYKDAKNWNVYDGNKWIKDAYKKYTDSVKK